MNVAINPLYLRFLQFQVFTSRYMRPKRKHLFIGKKKYSTEFQEFSNILVIFFPVFIISFCVFVFAACPFHCWFSDLWNKVKAGLWLSGVDVEKMFSNTFIICQLTNRIYPSTEPHHMRCEMRHITFSHIIVALLTILFMFKWKSNFEMVSLFSFTFQFDCPNSKSLSSSCLMLKRWNNSIWFQ